MKLIGSAVSPYVRRIRLLLDEQNYEFVDLNIYAPEGREVLVSYSPAMKVPVLVDGQQTVYDSAVIHRYLAEKLKKKPLSWDQENLLSLINAVNDSFIILLMASRSNLDTESDVLLLNLQKERIAQTMPLLEQAVVEGLFSVWNYPAICLFCFLDWVCFRELIDLETYPGLSAFCAAKRADESVAVSGPERG
ncbi:glutathione S-transferase family protein [Amphritea balenae]|uniref:Glutathione S-transferase family protein n=1 Tax=Amphritea balenae TaxID=452629 RepID=A0A3P1SRW2_9GAMM|nr:glutathione S-transferase N-terminal domain-containing protein [Amphritea balenae]RRC99887.1 glutathione S-transferase family protein [Amphritea balenae]GGK74843.1 hypothetical protein GCM10007941_26110 [Amphritea balenae]